MATIRKHRDKYQVQVRRKGYPSVSRSFQKLSDAKEWAREIERQADRQELAPDRRELTRITLRDLVVRYRDEVVISKKGVEIETIILNSFLKHPVCRRSLAELTPGDFAAYRDERLKTITAKSLKRQLSPLSNMFEIARVEWGIPLKNNPLRDLALRAVDNRRERRLRDGELARLTLAGERTRNRFVLPIVQFALETAMRRGEILSLCWKDVDLAKGTATIQEAKNGHSRVIPLTEAAQETLELVGGFLYRAPRVFPITPLALRLAWDRLTARAEIEDLHFHDLRHEAISRFFELGLTVPEVASISGHRDVRMLFRYAHANPSSLHRKLRAQSSA